MTSEAAAGGRVRAGGGAVLVAWMAAWATVALAVFVALPPDAHRSGAAIVGSFTGAFTVNFAITAFFARRVVVALRGGGIARAAVYAAACAVVWGHALWCVDSFVAFECRSMRTEARVNLAFLATREGVSATALPARPRYYLYQRVGTGGSALAVGVGRMDGDVLSVDDEGVVAIEVDGCAEDLR